jgi:hypothetical protein
MVESVRSHTKNEFPKQDSPVLIVHIMTRHLAHYSEKYVT